MGAEAGWIGNLGTGPHEITELCRLCAEYGKTHRASFPERPSAPRLTPKAHTIEKHIPLIAQRFGTIGLFGQDGGEAAHPKWKTASTLCRCVPNTIARVKATKFHFEAQQHCENINREKKTRVSKQQRERNAAAAAAAVAPAGPEWFVIFRALFLTFDLKLKSNRNSVLLILLL